MLVGWDAARADVLIGFDLAREGWVILLKHIVDSHRYRKSYRTVQFSFMITHPPFGPELTTMIPHVSFNFIVKTGQGS